MHGRLKVKTTAEQQEEKRKEKAKKLIIYRAAIEKSFQKRKNEEYDDEAISINHQLLLANPDITTLWNFQREILLKKKKLDEGNINELFNNELSFTESCLRVNPKSYGAWHHRCWVLDTMPDPDWKKELMLCGRFLELDERNFHCWDYRRFIVKRANVSPEDELEYTMKLINSNFSNYSAWHYRSKLLPLVYPDSENQINIQENIRLQELELVQNAAFTDPNDQSAWFYHRWLLGKDKPLQIEEPLKLLCFYINRVQQFVIVTLKKGVNLNSSRYNLNVTVDGQTIDGAWSPSNPGENVSSIWILKLTPEVIKMDECQKVSVFASGFYEETKELSVVLSSGQAESWALSIHNYSNYFGTELSAAETSLLESELNSGMQLMELEPDNKWASLAAIFLMHAIDPNKYETEILTHFRTLDTSDIDINRKNYYKDMLSKYFTENFVKRIPLIPHGECGATQDEISKWQTFREMKIIREDLTAVYNFEHLFLVTKLDLSSNKLQSLRQLHPLQCLRVLLVPNNLINSCCGLEHLPMLEEVDLDNNEIETANALESLVDCPKLKSLSLLNNPIKDETRDTIILWIKEHLPKEFICKI